MAFNVFRLTVLFTLAFAGYYFLSDDPRLAERYRRAVIAATGGSGICTISTRNGDSSAYQPQYTLIYNTPVDRASAVALCAAHGQVLARVTSPAGQPPFSSIVKQFCPDAPAALQGQSTWIASWNGDDYQGACLAVTGGTGPNVPIAVNVVPCEQKNYVLCSDAEQKGQSGFADTCYQCNPNPSGPTCDVTASCTKVTIAGTTGYQCACRAGFKDVNAWKLAGYAQSYRAFVAPGQSCNTVCNDNSCSEVRTINPNCMNGCFPGSATVQVHSSGGLDAKKVAFDELKAGMRMLVADRDGSTHYSDVAYVVNLSGDLLYKKIEYVAEDGKTGSVTLTLSHLIQKTASSGSSDATLVKAAEVKAGDYIYHNRAHRVIVTSTSTGMLKPGSGAYSAIPDRADALLIVDGILVSPYSKDHTLADMTFGTATRVLYRSLRFHNKQHWMDAAFCRQLAEALRPLFGNLVSVEAPKVEHLSMTVVAAVAGTLFYKKVRA